MIFRLFGSRASEEGLGWAAAAPDNTRVYAIGDIHGRIDLLEQLHAQIGADAADAAVGRKVIVYLGDYVDRGLHSRDVIDFLLKGPPDGFEAVYLKGNHEELMLRFIEDPKIGPGWFANGGGATLYSYGVRTLERGGDVARLNYLQQQLREGLPDTHLFFLRALAHWHVEGDYLFVHAGIRPGVPIEAQREEDMLWIRELFLNDKTDHGKIVVHGHTIIDRPEVRVNRIGIDTGAYASGVLTALALEGESYRFLQTTG